MPSARAFHGLSGAEIKTKILQEVQQTLNGDQRFAGHLTFPKVTWQWRLSLEAYPMEPGTMGVVAGGSLTAAPGRIIEVSNQPKFDAVDTSMPSEPALLDARGLAQRAIQRQLAREDPLPVLVPTPHDEMAELRTMVAELSGTVSAFMRQGLTVGSSLDPPISDTPTLREPARHGIIMETAAGRIEGGAAPSPGAGMAQSFGRGSSVGTITPRPDLIEVGVDHPSLEHGGVGPPDAVRRAAGLPVPTPQVTHGGGVVDFPAGTF